MLRKFRRSHGSVVKPSMFPVIMEADGETVKFLPRLRSPVDLHAVTGKPDIVIFAAEDLEHALYRHPVVPRRRIDATNAQYAAIVNNWRKQEVVQNLPDPYALVPKGTKYSVLVRCDGPVVFDGDLWGMSAWTTFQICTTDTPVQRKNAPMQAGEIFFTKYTKEAEPGSVAVSDDIDP